VRLAFVVGSDESTADPGVGRFYGGLIGALRAAGVEVVPVGLSEGPSEQLEALEGRLALGDPAPGRRGPQLLRQTAADLRDLLRWSAPWLPLPRGPFDVVLEYRLPNRFRASRIVRRDRAVHVLFLDEADLFAPLRPSLLRRVLHARERARYGRADVVCFRSGAVRDAYVERWGEPKLGVLQHMAVDPAVFAVRPGEREAAREALGVRDDEFLLGMAGFFAPYHGVDHVAPLVTRLRGAGVPARAVLVGAWSNELAAWLEAARLERPVEWEYVDPVGVVAPENVPGYLAAFDVGLMPASNWYGSPTKVFEYGAMRVPVVAARTGPAREVLREGDEGLLVEGPDELFEAVLSVWNDRAAAGERAERFRSRVEREHTWTARVADILDAIDGVRPV
jgi:glycosyltransferase involved in cell wall biosynthesis